MIYVITDYTGKFIDVGTAHIVVVQFALINQVHRFNCFAYDDVGVKMGEVDLAATKLKSQLVMK